MRVLVFMLIVGLAMSQLEVELKQDIQVLVQDLADGNKVKLESDL